MENTLCRSIFFHQSLIQRKSHRMYLRLMLFGFFRIFLHPYPYLLIHPLHNFKRQRLVKYTQIRYQTLIPFHIDIPANKNYLRIGKIYNTFQYAASSAININGRYMICTVVAAGNHRPLIQWNNFTSHVIPACRIISILNPETQMHIPCFWHNIAKSVFITGIINT